MQNLFKIVIILIISFFSQNTFAEDLVTEDLNSNSIYVSGVVIDIDVNTYGIEVPVGQKYTLNIF